MAQKNQNNDEHSEVEELIKNGQAFRFVSPFEKSAAYTKGEGDDKKMFVELLASSDQEDLVGDIMDIEALRDMEATAVGTIMLRDHNRSTDKIFGSIVEAQLKKVDGKNVLWIKAEVDDGDSQNIRIWKSIKKGTKLGASVTVIVLETAPNPDNSNGYRIKRAKLLEISIVTIPCNQDAWTLAAKAKSALGLTGRGEPTEDTDDVPSLEHIFKQAAQLIELAETIPDVEERIQVVNAVARAAEVVAKKMVERDEEDALVENLRGVLTRALEVTNALLREPLFP